MVECALPEGFSVTPGDCDDADAETNPDGIDYCGDGVDSDCTGAEDDCYDISIPEVQDLIVCDGTPSALRVTGDYLDISYNVHGLWKP